MNKNDSQPIDAENLPKNQPDLPDKPPTEKNESKDLRAILKIVQTETGHDFGSYKCSTLNRRIERRLATNNLSDLDSYISLLKKNPGEAESLSKDILIGVTGFFRDAEAFEIVAREVLPQLFANRGKDDPARIWHACCATGEEAYSMAILVREYLAAHKREAQAQIFATDLDETSIAQARAGVYFHDALGQTMDKERLQSFFAGRDDRYQVTKQLREMIVFACHDLLTDPPFSRLDLIVCRNALIYMNPAVQKRVIALFHQALKPGGFLFLGSSESLGKHSDLFVPIDKKWKIFRRADIEHPARTIFPFATPLQRSFGSSRDSASSINGEPDPGKVAEKVLMDRYSPPCIVVNDRYEVVYFSTRTSRYLEVPVGEPTRDILRMAREELRPALRAAIYKAITEQDPVDFRGIKILRDGEQEAVNVRVEPLNTSSSAKIAMVILEPAPLAIPLPPVAKGNQDLSDGSPTNRDHLVDQLEDQLRITHEQLQSTIEQLATSNEGLMSTNEELVFLNEEYQSANEELQSTNEELETSKEELQSLNEELTTVNAELQDKVEELDRLNSDMENLLASSEIAFLFLDRQLVIRRFSPALAEIFNLIPADIGRPYRHLGGTIDWPCLPEDAEKVLKTHRPIEREVQDRAGERHYSLRMLPYRTPFSKAEGIVVTLTDITERKLTEDQIRAIALFPEENLSPVLRVAGDGTLLYANRASTTLLDEWKCAVGGQIPDSVRRELTTSLKNRLNHEIEVRCTDRDLSFKLVPIPERDYVNFYGRDITEQKQAREKLRASEERFRVIFEQAAVGIAHVDLQGKILCCNHQFEKIIGYSEEQLAEITMEEITHPDDQAADQSSFKKLLTGESSSYSLEKRYLRSNDKPVWVHVSRSMVRNQDGEPAYCIAVIKDIEARKQAEEALRGSEAKLQTILENLHQGLIVSDMEGNLLHWNRAALEMHDFASLYECCRQLAEFSNEFDFSYLDGTILSPEQWPLTRILAGEHLDNLELQLRRHKTGWQRVFSYGGTLVYDSAGQPLMAVVTVMDITERKRSEEELRLSEERLKRAQAIGHLGSWELDLTSNRLIWSDEVYRILGLHPQEFEGNYENFLEAVHPNDRAAVDAAYTDSVVNGSDYYEIEHRVVRRSTGEVRIVHERCEHIRDKSGRLLRSYGMVHDITERKKIEDDLRLAKDAAEAATRAKSQFLANMSHELRTPMTGVLGMLELAMGGDLSSIQREQLAAVNKSAEALLRILNDILDFSRIEAGMLTFVEEPFQLSTCIQDVLEFFTLEARNKGLQLIHEVAPDIPELILGDESRIRQVLVNLLANALKFTERGKLTLQITCGELDEKGRRKIIFNISDTGIGISLQQQETLFQPFSQADLSHSRRYQGTGLGLAISKKIVEHLEGNISLISEPEKGSSFFITIPCRELSPRKKEQTENSFTDKSAVDQEDIDCKLLVAEDDPLVRDLLGHMLKAGGFDFDFATNGREAVRMWEEGNFDLILMDMQMPEMNGFEACRAIRERERQKDRRTPIVALTAVYQRDDQSGLNDDMDAWVAKPINFKKLFALIKKLIQKTD